MFDGTVGIFTRPILVARTMDGVKQLGVARGPLVGSTLHRRYYYDSASGVIKNRVAAIGDLVSDVLRKSGLQNIVTYTPSEVTDIRRSDVHLKLLSLYA